MLSMFYAHCTYSSQHIYVCIGCLYLVHRCRVIRPLSFWLKCCLSVCCAHCRQRVRSMPTLVRPWSHSRQSGHCTRSSSGSSGSRSSSSHSSSSSLRSARVCRKKQQSNTRRRRSRSPIRRRLQLFTLVPSEARPLQQTAASTLPPKRMPRPSAIQGRTAPPPAILGRRAHPPSEAGRRTSQQGVIICRPWILGRSLSPELEPDSPSRPDHPKRCRHCSAATLDSWNPLDPYLQPRWRCQRCGSMT